MNLNIDYWTILKKELQMSTNKSTEHKVPLYSCKQKSKMSFRITEKAGQIENSEFSLPPIKPKLNKSISAMNSSSQDILNCNSDQQLNCNSLKVLPQSWYYDDEDKDLISPSSRWKSQPRIYEGASKNKKINQSINVPVSFRIVYYFA